MEVVGLERGEEGEHAGQVTDAADASETKKGPSPEYISLALEDLPGDRADWYEG